MSFTIGATIPIELLAPIQIMRIQHYFDLKLPYFLELDFDKNRPLVIWGAGTKGKQLAKKLVEQKVRLPLGLK